MLAQCVSLITEFRFTGERVKESSVLCAERFPRKVHLTLSQWYSVFTLHIAVDRILWAKLALEEGRRCSRVLKYLITSSTPCSCYLYSFFFVYILLTAVISVMWQLVAFCLIAISVYVEQPSSCRKLPQLVVLREISNSSAPVTWNAKRTQSSSILTSWFCEARLAVTNTVCNDSISIFNRIWHKKDPASWRPRANLTFKFPPSSQ